MSTANAGQSWRTRGAAALVATASSAMAVALWSSPAGAQATRSDPAADKLMLVIYGLLGLAGVILVGTVVFWKVTRPSRLAAPIASYAPPSADPEPPVAVSERRGRSAAPVKIPASVILAELASTPPPTGTPDFDAPAPSAIPGADAAWHIEPDAQSGMLAETPTPVDFAVAAAATSPATGSTLVTSAAEAAPEVVPESVPEVVHEAAPTVLPEAPPEVVADAAPEVVADAAPEVVADAEAGLDVVTTVQTDDASVIETREGGPASLIAALAALPDVEPTRVEFDDPPVERVQQKRPPTGAPGFDRIARETAQQRRLEAQDA